MLNLISSSQEVAMLRLLALSVLLSYSTVACAAPLFPTLVKASTNVATFDPVTFGPGPNVDVYNLVVTNPNPYPATSIGLSLDGDFINLNSTTLTFKANAELPTLGPNKVAETFFVVPDPSKILAVGTIDTDDALASNFTSVGGLTFVPAQGSSIVAVMSIAAGSPSPDGWRWTGNAAVNGVLVPIAAFPEPTAGVLAGLALVGAAARRRG
jgi:hypothetical protein